MEKKNHNPKTHVHVSQRLCTLQFWVYFGECLWFRWIIGQISLSDNFRQTQRSFQSSETSKGFFQEPPNQSHSVWITVNEALTLISAVHLQMQKIHQNATNQHTAVIRLHFSKFFLKAPSLGLIILLSTIWSLLFIFPSLFSRLSATNGVNC